MAETKVAETEVAETAPFRRARNQPLPHPVFNQRFTTTLLGNQSFPYDRPKDRVWNPRVDQVYDKLLRMIPYDSSTGEYLLPAGTRLYHGSMLPDLDLLDRNASSYMTYFGLDAIISIWYVLEMAKRAESAEPGYLYTYELTRPLPVHLIRRLTDHPESHRDGYCESPEIVCVHPQLAYHGTNTDDFNDEPLPFELSVEVTIHTKYYRDFLRLLSVKQVDPMTLYEHRNTMMNEWHPMYAVTEQGNATASRMANAPWIELEEIRRAPASSSEAIRSRRRRHHRRRGTRGKKKRTHRRPR